MEKNCANFFRLVDIHAEMHAIIYYNIDLMNLNAGHFEFFICGKNVAQKL